MAPWLALLVLLLAQPAQAGELLTGPARVVDGDTLVVQKTRVRLRNFNAPELADPGGPEVRDFLKAIVEGRAVVCAGFLRDRYGRLLARCEVDGIDLADAMKAAGFRQKRRGG